MPAAAGRARRNTQNLRTRALAALRLFLDAHVSARRIAAALRAHQHDVRAADEERDLDGWEDVRLLELATTERRVMVTFNVKDFARLATEWAAAGTQHGGILLIVGIDHAEFGLTLRVIEAALEARPNQDSWVGYAAWGTRSAGT
jgi:hypothetical protein